MKVMTPQLQVRHLPGAATVATSISYILINRLAHNAYKLLSQPGMRLGQNNPNLSAIYD